MNKPIITEISLGNFTSGGFHEDCSVEVDLTTRVYGSSAVKVWNELHAQRGKALYNPDFGSKILNAIAPHPKVERVIFHNQATIVFWDDGEKTVVKCRECGAICKYEQVDTPVESFIQTMGKICCPCAYDPEKAVMAAMLKRLYKNFQDPIRKAIEEVTTDE